MRRTLISTLFVLLAAAASGQQRYDDAVRHNAWNMGGGVAGLRCDSLSTSYAEIYALKEGGGMKPSYASDDSWNFGAQMRSILRMEKISFAGGFGFDYFRGRNMCGSMFGEPGYYPVDILEFTPGVKIRETYTFDGGLSAELGRGLLLGVGIDFEAGSYSKRKDLRHKNNILDFGVMPSLTYRFADGAAGVTYIFAKRGESLSANEYGISSETYDAFFDKGICFGEQSLWTGNGIHLDYSGVSGFPVREFANGAMVQAEWHGVYADVSYRRRTGRTGEKQTIWHEFAADDIAAHAAANFGGRWFVRASFSLSGQTNNENVLNSVTDNGVTTDRKFGSNTVFARNTTAASLEAEYCTARWLIVAGGRWRSLERLSTLSYPHWRSHTMNFGELFADARATFGSFEVSLSVAGGKGGSEMSGDGADDSDYPLCRTDFLAAETEWYTAARICAGAGLRYNIRKFYVDLRGDYMRGFNTVAIGRDRWSVRLSAGYRF